MNSSSTSSTYLPGTDPLRSVAEGVKDENKKKKLDAVYREKASRNELAESLGLLAEAIEQIDGKQYDTTFRAEGIADVEKIGLAYFKNAVEICH